MRPKTQNNPKTGGSAPPASPSALVFVGIDPALRASGYAHAPNRGPIVHGRVDGVENVAAAARAIVSAYPPGTRFSVAVEYPTWKGHGTESVRGAANAWIRAIREAAGSRAVLHKVSPPTWMGAMGFTVRPPRTPADLYVPWARRETGDPDIDHNAAAAVCLRLWAIKMNAEEGGRGRG